MLRQAALPATKDKQLISWLLLAALVFAGLHVALHDWAFDNTGTDPVHECEACRLNHVPLASLPLPSLLSPLQLLRYVAPVADTRFRTSAQSHIQRARAPPLF